MLLRVQSKETGRSIRFHQSPILGGGGYVAELKLTSSKNNLYIAKLILIPSCIV